MKCPIQKVEIWFSILIVQFIDSVVNHFIEYRYLNKH